AVCPGQPVSGEETTHGLSAPAIRLQWLKRPCRRMATDPFPDSAPEAGQKMTGPGAGEWGMDLIRGSYKLFVPPSSARAVLPMAASISSYSSGMIVRMTASASFCVFIDGVQAPVVRIYSMFL
ncbi:hypothetical protein, partial [Plasticicumulans lactativorans]|uniref:hypothetical protein n=1 Tax=Plasticicumulans lactativorans TaxID=1133106 RepID=UPI001A9FE39F